jgi:hypothetical protein
MCSRANYRYLNAVVMQIAALEDDPASAHRVSELRAVLPPRPVRMVVPDYGVEATIDWLGTALPRARFEILARRKDYTRIAEAAPIPLRSDGSDPLQGLFDALMTERDWRGFDIIARERDPRTTKRGAPHEPWALRDYVTVTEELALLAAQAGDDGPAKAFLADAYDVWDILRAGWPNNTIPGELDWKAALLAGVADGRLPRRHLYLARGI